MHGAYSVKFTRIFLNYSEKKPLLSSNFIRFGIIISSATLHKLG